MDLEDCKSAVGFCKDSFIDSKWIDASLYVSRTNRTLLNKVALSTKNRGSQIMLANRTF